MARLVGILSLRALQNYDFSPDHSKMTSFGPMP
jgi:hypothetical protein